MVWWIGRFTCWSYFRIWCYKQDTRACWWSGLVCSVLWFFENSDAQGLKTNNNLHHWQPDCYATDTSCRGQNINEALLHTWQTYWVLILHQFWIIGFIKFNEFLWLDSKQIHLLPFNHQDKLSSRCKFELWNSHYLNLPPNKFRLHKLPKGMYSCNTLSACILQYWHRCPQAKTFRVSLSCQCLKILPCT